MLYSLLNVKREAPEIVTLPEPIKMAGVEMRTGAKSIFNDSQTLGKRYQQIKAQGLVRHKKQPWGFVAISKAFGSDGSWDYLMGDVVTTFDDLPEGLVHYEIPARAYAKFRLQPRALIFWGVALGLLKRYIYTEWLPNSVYVADPALIGDFEYHDARSIAEKPEIDLYVAIKEKE